MRPDEALARGGWHYRRSLASRVAVLTTLALGVSIAMLSLTAAVARAQAASDRDVLAFVQAWRDAWAAQDAEAYLALYAADARVDARDRAAFEAHKRALFARGDAIDVKLGDVMVDSAALGGETLVRVVTDRDEHREARIFGHRQVGLDQALIG